MKKSTLLIFLLPLALIALNPNPPPPPQVVQAELDKAEHDFWKAMEMFNPWYAGPLLTPSAHVLDPGYLVIQPYIFVLDNYGKYNTRRHSQDIPKLIQVNPLFLAQTGVVKGIDATLVIQGIYNTQNDVHSGGYLDTKFGFGFQIVKEQPYIPAVKVVFSELFPTGKYRNLDPDKNGLDGVGGGAFVTNVSLNISKVFWWVIPSHPFNLRTSHVFSIPSKVHVKNFNSYGGGFGTNGKVRPGQQYTGDIGIEVSITQSWVFATDISYFYFGKSKFKGTPGTTSSGAPATVGGSFGDQLSLAPAIEYNPSSKIGVLGGVWFSVYGRNTSNFIAGVVSYTQTF